MNQSLRPQDYKTLRQKLPRRLDWLLHDLHWVVLRAYHGVFQPTFEFEGNHFRYDLERRGIIQERDIEIPLAKAALQVLPDPLEVGCVLPHYGAAHHDVIDLYETCGMCRKVDASGYPFGQTASKSVISISTLEHIGWDLPESVDPEKAVGVLRTVLSSGQPFFITFPVGYNPYLTEFLQRMISGSSNSLGDGHLIANVQIFRRKAFDRWQRVSIAEAEFDRFHALNRKPTRYLAILWKGVTFRPLIETGVRAVSP